MKSKVGKSFVCGAVFSIIFIIWTVLIKNADVKPLGVNGTEIGFSKLNISFHNLMGVNMDLYYITDWMGLVPVFVCMLFALIGIVQLIKRKSIFKVDADVIITGIYYAAVIFFYLIFEMYPINYRPVLIDGFMEASYPSSTTLLVLSVMPTLLLPGRRRIKSSTIKKIISVFVVCFSAFTVLGRLISGVHWLSDIIGSVFLCIGLYNLYKGAILIIYNKRKSG